MSDEFIFVYGTLRKAFAIDMHQPLVECGEFFSEGSMQGKLYEVEGYPGVIESDNAADKVVGELYRIHDRDALLSVLDDYEMCSHAYPQPHEYVRKKVAIQVAEDKSVSAWVYIYNYPVLNLYLIESGDYVDYAGVV